MGASTIVHAGSAMDRTIEAAGTLLASSDTLAPRDEGDPATGPVVLPPTTRVGRYALGEPLGAGGMGVVYRARDPELERPVAIKVLLSDRGEHRVNDRFLREAQAMARLSHPNVVPIYDVGAWGSGLFLAMELVDGETLRKWMQGPHTWREVVAMFVQAGRGLAEAHAAGIVHRDFKPENVLVDGRGRARVTDFGLARPDAPTSAPAGSRAIDEGDHLTRSGTILGTPAYMAPEQLVGRPVDPRADVFAFCVALYEALHGHTPFGGRTFAERIQAIDLGAIRLPNRRLPRWLLRAVVRGLAAKATERPDMATLLALLERGLARRSTWLAVGLGAGLAASLGFALGERAPRCEGAGEAMAELWDEDARAGLTARLRASDRPYAADTARTVEELIGAYATAWSGLQRESCEAHARGEISAGLLDRRTECLLERRADLAQLMDTLGHADATTVEKAVAAARSLEPVEHCRDPEAEVRDPSELAWAEATRARIAGVRLLEITGKSAEGLTEIEAIEAEVAEHADEALRLEALFMRARLEQARGEHGRASEVARRVLGEAHRQGRDRLATQAATLLVLVDGGARARYEVGEAWAQLALAGAARIGGDGREEANVRQYYGAMLSSADRSAEALAQLERALALRTGLLGADDLDTSLTEMTLGNALWKVGRHEEARVHHQAAVRTREAILGREHPALIAPLANLGVTADALGLTAEAREAWSRSLALIEANLGANHPNAAALHANLGSLEIAAGDLAAARSHCEASVRIARAVYGADHPDTGLVLATYASVLMKQGELDAAEATVREALAATERSVGAEHSNHAIQDLLLGRLLRLRGRTGEAREHVQAALANTEKSLGAKHPRAAEALVELAELEGGAGEIEAAVGHLERAAQIVEAGEVQPGERGRTLFALARALAERDPGRAATLIGRATELSERAGPAGAELRAELASWRAAHP